MKITLIKIIVTLFTCKDDRRDTKVIQRTATQHHTSQASHFEGSDQFPPPYHSPRKVEERDKSQVKNHSLRMSKVP